MSSWLDILPSSERAKIRQKLRSPEEYERLREKVKGPEDLEREMKWNEAMAELSFAIETEPTIKEALKNQIEKDLREEGVEVGDFDILVEENPETNQDQLMMVPEGNVGEKIPVKKSLSEQYVYQFQIV